MSMLAEVKRKTRIGLNPRGTLWTNDENKFGQKLLEKMGWAKGKGLGKDEQGLQEPIRVSMNSENKGVGFKDNSEDWSQHYQGFEDVLAGLNGVSNTDNETEQNLSDGQNNLENVESLEMKSKNLKSRVHYKKFTRSKDLSRYNDDDLACVLGSKKAAKKGNAEPVGVEEETQREIGQTANSYGLTTVYGGNLKDYFTQKMAELKRKREEGILGDGACISEAQTPSRSKRQRLSSVPNTPFPDLEFEPQRTEFSFNYSVNEPELECESVSPELKKKKKKKKSKDSDLEAEEVVSVDSEKKKKKKHKKDKKGKNEESDKENVMHEEINENKEKQKEEKLSNVCVDDPNEGSKKKKKKHKNKDAKVECISIDEIEIFVKKKKKKRNERKETNCEEGTKIHLNNCDNENSENKKEEKLNVVCEDHSNEKEEKKKRKKHKSKDVEVESNSIDASEISVKKNKKKKEKHNETDTDINTNSCNNNDISENQMVSSTEMNESYLQATCKTDKIKKKKRKDRNEEEENNESEKPLKKLKNFASEISLTDILKSTSEKCDNRNNDADDSLTAVESEVIGQEEKKPKVKLTSKRSFKELKNDLEKIRKKVMKRNKKDLNTIEEEGNKPDVLVNSQINIKDIPTENLKSTGVNVMVPIKENEDGYDFKLKKYKSVKVDVEKLFSGSNLTSIVGYNKSK